MLTPKQIWNCRRMSHLRASEKKVSIVDRVNIVWVQLPHPLIINFNLQMLLDICLVVKCVCVASVTWHSCLLDRASVTWHLFGCQLSLSLPLSLSLSLSLSLPLSFFISLSITVKRIGLQWGSFPTIERPGCNLNNFR